jgi:RimJ/RimL family protein N-acetyltransferase
MKPEGTTGASSVAVPRIATRRLLLRELRASDFDVYAENMADPVAAEYVAGPIDRRTAWRMFAASTGCWMLNGTGWWGVELRETGDLVGTVGAFYRDNCAELELGWRLFRRFWRRGFATEAAAAVLAFAFDELAAPRAIAHIAKANLASIRVSQQIGMRYETDVDFYGERIGRYVVER